MQGCALLWLPLLYQSNHMCSTCRLDDAHVDAIVAEVLWRLDRIHFEAPTYAVDLDNRAQVRYIVLQWQNRDTRGSTHSCMRCHWADECGVPKCS
jgi:hypothetical protein